MPFGLRPTYNFSSIKKGVVLQKAELPEGYLLISETFELVKEFELIKNHC